ncbi:MAG: hypothetical protein ND895_15020 [Pyrinomonadaceae bacterium]|nr:hypothetical protein [Pyrinomonadaceae bacterium]
MRRTLIMFLFIISLTVTAIAQIQPFTKDELDYALDLPSPSWRAISRLDVHDHMEFVYGDDYSNGYLRLRKKFVSAGTGAEVQFRHDEQWELRSLPGYVVCSDGRGTEFEGHLRGTVFSYEYINRGRNMDGRIYYLQLDNRTFYVLHFTVASDKLRGLRSQMDSIVKSFRLK